MRVRFTDGLTEVVVPFWTTTLTARDQSGEEMEDAQLHVYQVEHSPLPGQILPGTGSALGSNTVQGLLY